MSKDTLALIYASVLTLCFFVAGIFNVLDNFMIKTLLFVGFALFAVYLVIHFLKDIENKNHPE
ncbi:MULTISPECIES: hypothetical protein [Flavobacteriaceae]|jgi:membrane protein implicated in regulation of membrane protease activity|uniref:Gliding motility protein GldL n=1 Tax=Meridianimaribacter flavus TaxID=571115 RepID=A0ABY2G520_9FLAO|nr:MULTISPECIES: hypothetical protein [Flavobacteriaceae]RYH72906.1 hypothetical protein EVU94_11895 [Flavobacteriaceae bacterium 144Ye]TBV25621.1 hypothetical protein DMZ43_11830 [Meridianimaribacter sp. CL38]TDY11903.1 hypothetical protein A8975_1743 [Meridianimaribacter flavus]